MHALWLSWRRSSTARDISVPLFLCSRKSPQPHPLAPGFLLRLESSLIGGEATAAATAATFSEAGSSPRPVLWEHFPVTLLADWTVVGAEHITDSEAKDNREILVGCPPS